MIRLHDIIHYLIYQCGVVVSRIKVVKLLYLADILSKEKTGHTLTGLTYVYHFYGPYNPKIIEALIELDNSGAIQEVYDPILDKYVYEATTSPPSLPHEIKEILDEVVCRYCKMDLDDLISVTYDTPQMQRTRPGEVIII